MKASKPAEIIHMTYITTSTVKEGKVAVLMSVDNYSEYCYGIAVEMDLCLESVEKHVSAILIDVQKHHPKTKPLFIMAYGKEFIPALEEKHLGKAKFMYNPVLADEKAMPVAKVLMKEILKNNKQQ